MVYSVVHRVERGHLAKEIHDSDQGWHGDSRRQERSLVLGPEALGLWGPPPGVGRGTPFLLPRALQLTGKWDRSRQQPSSVGIDPIWNPGSERRFYVGSRGTENCSETEQGRLPNPSMGTDSRKPCARPNCWPFFPRMLFALLGWVMSGLPASGYLDGEPAKAVLEVQRSLVFAEGNGVLGVQPFKLLLVVDYKNLPENTLVRIPENTSIGGQGESWRRKQNLYPWAG